MGRVELFEWCVVGLGIKEVGPRYGLRAACHSCGRHFRALRLQRSVGARLHTEPADCESICRKRYGSLSSTSFALSLGIVWSVGKPMSKGFARTIGEISGLELCKDAHLLALLPFKPSLEAWLFRL